MKKVLYYFAIVVALIIALTYALGYDYLFKGVAKTYLRGETSATIDDGKLFPKNVILAENPKPWVKDSLYNKRAIPAAISEKLQKTQSASYIVIKNNKLLQEHYWENHNATSKTNSFSMAKTVTALLLGAAIDDEKIKNENQLFSDFYPQYGNTEFGKYLSLKNLVTMESGLDWNENYQNTLSPNAKAYYGNSLANAVLSKQIIEMPGRKFQYQSGSTQLLGFAIRKAINMSMASYASKKLWNPLGMENNADWTTDENGMEKTFCCIQSNAKDYAKLGQLMLDDGKANGVQIISKNYIQKMITPTSASRETYGYGIWTNLQNKYPYYYFRGILGQYIIIIPAQKIVIVRTGNDENITFDKKGHPTLVDDLVQDAVENL